MNKYLEKIANLVRSVPNAFRRASQVSGAAVNRAERLNLSKEDTKKLLKEKFKKGHNVAEKSLKDNKIGSGKLHTGTVEGLALTRAKPSAFKRTVEMDL